MQKANQNKKLIKLMSGVLAVLTISTPASLATKPIPLEDKPGILEKLKSLALPAAIIGGAIIITGAVIYGISKIKESKSREEFKDNIDLALKGIANKTDLEYVLNEIEEMLEPKIENNRINEFKLRFKEFKTKVQNLDDINAAKRELSQGLHAIVKTFNIRFDIDEFNRRKSNKAENTAEKQPNTKEEVKIESNSEIKVQSKIEKNEDKSSGENNKPKLPDEFDIFKIAVIGSDIVNGNEIVDEDYGEEHSLNKFTVDKLCTCKKYAKKLSDYAGVTTDGEEIVLYNERLPKNSFYYGKSAFSFYYVHNCDEAAKILPQCQIAICPFFANRGEVEGNYRNYNRKDCELKKHLIRLRDFVKQYQHMCEVRFLYYTDRITDPSELSNYIHPICDLCTDLYYNGEYGRDKWLRQDVISNALSTEDENSYDRCMEHMWSWSQTRAEEFKTWTGNDVLHVNRYQ